LTRITVPDNCFGINMEDGTSYSARNGHVEVDDRHLKYIGNHVLDVTAKITGGFAKTDYDLCCTDCQKSAWKWQKKCSKCGGEIIDRARIPTSQGAIGY
jgi:hypothetical protein